MSTKPSCRGAPQYLRFLITTGATMLRLTASPFSTTSPALPPSSLATARSPVWLHSIGRALPDDGLDAFTLRRRHGGVERRHGPLHLAVREVVAEIHREPELGAVQL